MIISYSKKFVFIAIPKTATHAIRNAIRPYVHEDTLEQVGLFVNKRFPFAQTQHIRHGHISAAEILPVIGSDQWPNFFKFAFVRNPFARFISYCAFIGRENQLFLKAPQQYMWHMLNNPPTDHILFRPQFEFLYSTEGTLLVDFIGQHETIEEDFKTIADKIDIPYEGLIKINHSKHAHYAQYFDSELEAAVADLYQEDFELFGYQPYLAKAAL